MIGGKKKPGQKMDPVSSGYANGLAPKHTCAEKRSPRSKAQVALKNQTLPIAMQPKNIITNLSVSIDRPKAYIANAGLAQLVERLICNQ